MNRNDRLGPTADRPLQLIRTQCVGSGINVDENGASAGVMYGGDRSDKGKWNGDHLMPRSDSESQQGQMESAGAGIHGHGVTSAAILGKIMFKGFDLLSQDEMPTLENRGDRLADLVLDRPILSLQVQERD